MTSPLETKARALAASLSAWPITEADIRRIESALLAFASEVERDGAAAGWEAAATLLRSGMPAEVVVRMAEQNAACLRSLSETPEEKA